MSRKELKKKALDNLNHKWGSAIINFLIVCFALFVLSISFLGGLLFSSLILMAYMNVYYQGRDKQEYNPGDFITPFNDNLIGRIVLSIKKTVFIMLWSLLFAIPGIIKFFSYSMSEYISLQNPEWDSRQCIDESRRIMNGHKFELFMVYLSFLGWMILSSFTFGILYFVFVGPYMHATIFNFYEELYNEDKGIYISSR